ncbi:DUF1573 domain-containing protein [Flavobacterium sp.]|uniref:DUF1573 domain-containing protein n=1 Tax=Flavobacterium sp. TaxID=239 RepID=UPI0025CB92D5|nr:DUF1573 domain-containing protein [Flavobacterium sp.]
MKRIILLAAITVFGVATSNAQTAKKPAKKADTPVKVETPKVDGPGMLFENEIIDYGTIPKNADGKREFVFVNNGNKPLIIESTQGSCGCTVPSKPEGAIAPGAKGVIGVKYATDREGAFTKTVTIKSNAAGQETKVVTIKGTVLPAAPADAAAPTKS